MTFQQVSACEGLGADVTHIWLLLRVHAHMAAQVIEAGVAFGAFATAIEANIARRRIARCRGGVGGLGWRRIRLGAEALRLRPYRRAASPGEGGGGCRQIEDDPASEGSADKRCGQVDKGRGFPESSHDAVCA